jgi:hypothetical protein
MYPYYITLIIFSRKPIFPSFTLSTYSLDALMPRKDFINAKPNPEIVFADLYSRILLERDCYTVIVMSNHDGKIMNTRFQCCCLLATNTTISIKSNGDIVSHLCRERHQIY